MLLMNVGTPSGAVLALWLMWWPLIRLFLVKMHDTEANSGETCPVKQRHGGTSGFLLGHAGHVPLGGWSTSRLLTFLIDSHTQ